MLSANYVKRQVMNLLPEEGVDLDLIDLHMALSIERTEECIGTLIDYKDQGFNYLNSSQYATFLYFLANSIYIKSGDQIVPERLFLLNKMISGVDLWYKIRMPDYFSLSHALGSVFSNATYGNYSIFFQGCTIGKNNNNYPVLSDGVIMFPGSVVAGKCNIGENTIISSGVRIIDQDTPGNCFVFQGGANELIIKESTEYYAERYFIRKR
jgi:serine O-acetyltransferase